MSKNEKYLQTAQAVLRTVGGAENVNSGGQFQVIIGTTVDQVYTELCRLGGFHEEESIEENLDELATAKGTEKFSAKTIINRIFAYLSGSLTPLIPILLVCSLCRTVAAIIGPQLMGGSI